MSPLVRRLYIALGVLAWALLCVYAASATDLGCGVDTDRNDSVDALCPTPDADNDGYLSVADGGTDCDDTNHYIYPGISTEGSSAGNFKTCQSNGTYTASAANSTYSCKSGSGVNRWVSASVADCGHTGDYTHQNNYRCFFDTTMSGYTALSPGDCVIFQSGTYTDTFSSALACDSATCMVVTRVAGNSTDKIHIEAEPGTLVTIDSPGTSVTGNIIPFQISTNYIVLNGNAIGKRPGFYIGNGYSGSGVYNHGADNVTIQNVYAADVDGNCFGSDNCAGIKVDSSSDNVSIHHNHTKNIYEHTGGIDRTSEISQNSSGIEMSYGTGNSITYNVLEAGSQNVMGHAGFFYKHCERDVTNTWTYQYNLIAYGGRDANEFSCGGGNISHNVVIDPSFAAFKYSGGNGSNNFQDDSVIEYNTVVNAWPLELFDGNTHEQMQQPFTATAATDLIAYSGTNADWVTGTPVTVGTTGTLPGGLSAQTLYYISRQGTGSAKLSTTSNGLSPIDITSAGTGTHNIYRKFGSVAVRYNVWQDNLAGAYSADGTTGFVRVCHYCLDTLYTPIRNPLGAGAVYSFTSNDHYNTTAQALLYLVFNGADAGETLNGASYANFTAWQGSGFSTTEKSEDPHLDVYSRANTPNTYTWGWRTGTTGAATPTPTPTPSGALRTIAFRASSGLVTDVAGGTYSRCNTDAAYPSNSRASSLQTETFGWTHIYADSERDRSASASYAPLAGLCQTPNTGTQDVFKWDVGAGNYDICLGVGDFDNDQAPQHVDVYDNTTLRFTLNDALGTTARHWDDTTALEYPDSTFLASQACQTNVSIASGTLVMKTGATTNTGGNTTVSFVSVQAAATPTPTPSPSPSPTPVLGTLRTIAMRASSGFVTDPTGGTYSLGNLDTSYASGPVVRGGETFGWTSVYADCARDRSAGVAYKPLAGICQRPNNGTQATFRWDVGAGNYNICFGMGDQAGAQTYQRAEVFDNATSRFSMTDASGTGANGWDDTSGVELADTAFLAGQVCQSNVSIASGILNLTIGATSNVGGNSTLSFVSVQTYTTPTPTPTPSPKKTLLLLGD